MNSYLGKGNVGNGELGISSFQGLGIEEVFRKEQRTCEPTRGIELPRTQWAHK